MADTAHKISDQMIDWATRLENASDAAKGKAVRRRGPSARWLLLPATGAGLYALATSGAFSRQAKDVLDQARTRASELPDDLMGRIRQTTQKSSETTTSKPTREQGRRRQTTAPRSGARRKATGSSRK